MKRILVLPMLFLVMGLFTFSVAAEETEWQQVVSTFGLDELDQAAPEEIVSFLKELELTPSSPESMQNLSIGTLFSQYAQDILRSAQLPGQIARWLMGFGVFAFVIRTLSSSNQKWIGQTTDFVMVLLCGLWIISPINELFGEISEAMASAVVYIHAFVPVFAGLLTASGFPALAGTYSVVLMGYTSAFSALQQTVLVPGCRLLLALSVCFPLAGVSAAPVEGLRKILVSALSVLSGVLTAIVGLQTKLSSVSDNLVTKTAKTALSAFVPIVGPTLSESLNVILGSLDLARSSVGIYTAVTLILLFAAPLGKLLCWQITLWIGKACLEAAGEKTVVAMLGSVSSLLTILMAVMLSGGLMILLTVFLVMSVGRGT